MLLLICSKMHIHGGYLSRDICQNHTNMTFKCNSLEVSNIQPNVITPAVFFLKILLYRPSFVGPLA